MQSAKCKIEILYCFPVIFHFKIRNLLSFPFRLKAEEEAEGGYWA